MKTSLVWVGTKYEFRRGYMWKKKAGMLAKITKIQFAKLYPWFPFKGYHHLPPQKNTMKPRFEGIFVMISSKHPTRTSNLGAVVFWFENPSPHTSLGSVPGCPEVKAGHPIRGTLGLEVCWEGRETWRDGWIIPAQW